MNLIELKNITVKKQGEYILRDINLQVDYGEIVSITGPNGSGKSTLLKVICGMIPMHSGGIFWKNKPIKVRTHKITEMEICYLPQDFKIFPNLTVEENLQLFGFSIKNTNTFQLRLKDVFYFFPILNLKLKQKADFLSGGQKQMLSLARILLMRPKLLLLDEPLTGLSSKISAEVILKIKEISKKNKIAIIIVEHNIAKVAPISSKTYLLKQGEINLVDFSEN